MFFFLTFRTNPGFVSSFWVSFCFHLGRGPTFVVSTTKHVQFYAMYKED